MGWFGLLISVSVEEPCMVWLLKGESQLPNLQGPRTFIQRLILRRETSGLGKLDKEEVWAAINEKKRLRPEGDVRHNRVKHDSEPDIEQTFPISNETRTRRGKILVISTILLVSTCSLRNIVPISTTKQLKTNCFSPALLYFGRLKSLVGKHAA